MYIINLSYCISADIVEAQEPRRNTVAEYQPIRLSQDLAQLLDGQRGCGHAGEGSQVCVANG